MLNVLPPIALCFFPCSKIALLGMTCRSMRRSIFIEDEGWWTLCVSLCNEFGLYMPNGYEAGHRSLFFDLFPARHKWRGEDYSDTLQRALFTIQVSVRFRPGAGCEGESGKLFLPLHQRLRLRKEGEKISADSAALSLAELNKLIGEAGGDLTPEVMQALLDSEALRSALQQAKMEASNSRRALPEWVDSVDDTVFPDANVENNNAEFENDNPNVFDRWSPRSGARGASESEAQEDDSSSELSDIKRGSRVLLVQRSRVQAFVPGVGIRPFYFGRVFDKDASQEDVYHFARNAVLSALNGYNACVLCYGQTGSGKTHTVFGGVGWIEDLLKAAKSSKSNGQEIFGGLKVDSGIAPRMCAELLAAAASSRSNPNSPYRIRVAAHYVEIYNEEITDLTTGKILQLRDTGRERRSQQFVLHGCGENSVENMAELSDILWEGEKRKRFGCTRMNVRSSRAHTCLILTITQTNKVRHCIVRSQLHIVDLAGSEQIRLSGSILGQRKRELVGINSSLHVLRRCITALSENHSHVPYHESKLTMLLKGAFGGNCKTTAIINASLLERDGDQTIQALRFGEDCSTITNKTVQATVSFSSALKAIDESLHSCSGALQNLTERKLTHLPCFRALKERHDVLLHKRRDIIESSM